MNNYKYLAHHGVMGQKWGVRRYQNEDGTLTEAGKDRYGVSLDGNKSNDGKTQYIKDLQDHRDQEKKAGIKNSSLTKDELKELRDIGKQKANKIIGSVITAGAITAGVVMIGRAAYDSVIQPMLELLFWPITIFFK